VAIDLGDETGREVAQRLALRADVVLESFLPGGADRLGLGYDALSAARPGLVYTSIAGYSPESVDAHRPGFDFAIQGEAGGMSITGEPDGPPLKVGVAIADITTGMFASIGTLAALRDAAASGRSHHVQVSLFDSQLAWLANRGSDYLVAGEEPHRLGNAHPAIVPYEAFATSDGHVIVAIGTNEQFTRFCSAAGLAGLAGDERYATNPQRVEHRIELVERLAGAIARRPTADWLEVLAQANVPGGPVRTIPEAFAHAPYAVVEHAHPLLGSVRTVRSPIGIDGAYRTAAAAPPLLGQHTDEVLAELGYDHDTRTRLLAGACRLA
ncbi:MAG: hypothetical protein QOF54_1541, partial [Solirubrobacteraceae bacterium]|nr:hypothetical protein [Solirubrobacteraceae bacterium]